MKIQEIAAPPAPPQPPAVPKRLLVIVHPGSACGSADFNLGRYSARGEREYLARDIAGWQGSVLVIDGQLSDELPSYRELNTAILGALERAHATGISMRLYGDDDVPPHQNETAANFIKQQRLDPREWQIDLTGAWIEENSGCVRGVWNVFVKAGFRADVRDSVLTLPEGEAEGG